MDWDFYSTIRPGPNRLYPARNRPAQARPHLQRKGNPAAFLRTRTVFCTPPQRTRRTDSASPQVDPRPQYGLARAVYADSDKSRLSWVTPIRFTPTSLVSGAMGVPTIGWPI